MKTKPTLLLLVYAPTHQIDPSKEKKKYHSRELKEEPWSYHNHIAEVGDSKTKPVCQSSRGNLSIPLFWIEPKQF